MAVRLYLHYFEEFVYGLVFVRARHYVYGVNVVGGIMRNTLGRVVNAREMMAVFFSTNYVLITTEITTVVSSMGITMINVSIYSSTSQLHMAIKTALNTNTALGNFATSMTTHVTMASKSTSMGKFANVSNTSTVAKLS